MVFEAMIDNPYLDSLEVRVLSATPLELVVILYDAAIDAVRASRGHLAAGEIHKRSQAVTKAVTILIELSRSLNFELGGDLSTRLGGLYAFMRTSLLEANFRQTDDGLATTETLLVSLREAWIAVNGQSATPVAEPSPKPDSAAAFPWSVLNQPVSGGRHWSA